jgi:hypothetical protein
LFSGIQKEPFTLNSCLRAQSMQTPNATQCDDCMRLFI